MKELILVNLIFLCVSIVFGVYIILTINKITENDN